IMGLPQHHARTHLQSKPVLRRLHPRMRTSAMKIKCRGTLFAVLGLLLSATAATARTEYFLRVNGQPIKGEVCFFHAGPTTAPSDRWFYSNDVRCYPSQTLLDHPIARLHFFGRAPGFISNFGTMLTNSEEQRPDSYKRVPIDLVPSATVDTTEVPLKEGESLAILAAATATTNGILLPLPTGTHQTQVPAELPLLALKIANRTITAVSTPFTLSAGSTGTPAFAAPNTTSGTVVAWLKIPRELYADGVITEDRWGELRTHLECGAIRRAPLWNIEHSQIASGQLQIFTNVPPGRCTAVVDGDLWQPAATIITSVPGTVSTAAEALDAIPAAIITAHYELAASPVPITAPLAADCTNTPAPASIMIDLFTCAAATAECRAGTQPYTADHPAIFTRLRPGTYSLRATHPNLGATTGTTS